MNTYDIYLEQANPGIEMQDVAKDIADAIHEAIKNGGVYMGRKVITKDGSKNRPKFSSIEPMGEPRGLTP